MAREHRRQSRERRAALVEAAITVLAARGAAGMTHRAVTESAGVPLATVSYFWSSIDELTDEALASIVATDSGAITDLARKLGEDFASADDVAAFIDHLAAPNRRETLAQFEAYLHAARNPDHRENVAVAIDAFRAIAEVTLRGAGVEDAKGAAAATVALSDGHALHQIATASGPQRAALEGAFRALVAGYLLQQGEVEAALRVVGSEQEVAR